MRWLFAAAVLTACSAHGGATTTFSGTPTSCTAEYVGPAGENLSASCDDVSGVCDCFRDGTRTSTCQQAVGGCYPEGGAAGAICCPGIPTQSVLRGRR